MCACAQSCPTLFRPRNHQTPLSMEFSRQEHWNGLPFPTPGDLADPEIKPVSLVSSALVGVLLTTARPEEQDSILF